MIIQIYVCFFVFSAAFRICFIVLHELFIRTFINERGLSGGAAGIASIESKNSYKYIID